jgi:hypothetical protein
MSSYHPGFAPINPNNANKRAREGGGHSDTLSYMSPAPKHKTEQNSSLSTAQQGQGQGQPRQLQWFSFDEVADDPVTVEFVPPPRESKTNHADGSVEYGSVPLELCADVTVNDQPVTAVLLAADADASFISLKAALALGVRIVPTSLVRLRAAPGGGGGGGGVDGKGGSSASSSSQPAASSFPAVVGVADVRLAWGQGRGARARVELVVLDAWNDMVLLALAPLKSQGVDLAPLLGSKTDANNVVGFPGFALEPNAGPLAVDEWLYAQKGRMWHWPSNTVVPSAKCERAMVTYLVKRQGETGRGGWCVCVYVSSLFSLYTHPTPLPLHTHSHAHRHGDG